MLERILSPRGLKIYFIVFLVLFGYILWLSFTNAGIGAWINNFQATHLFSGYYYPELTLLLLCIPMIVISFGFGFLHDFLTDQGIFLGRENNSDLVKPISPSKLEYQETSRKDMIDLVRSKYRDQIYQLKLLGFEELGFYRETIEWFGLSMGMFGLLGAIGLLANEITKMGPRLTVNGFYMSLVSKRDRTYASVSKAGISFFTNFIDGTTCISTSYKGAEIHNDSHKLYRTASPRAIQATWKDHQGQVNKFLSEGKETKGNISMTDFLSAVKRLDDYMLGHVSEMSKSLEKDNPHYPGIITTIISTIVSMGILLACVFILMFIGNIISHVYPTCWIVRNLKNPSLPLDALGIVGCIATSWILARLQHNLLTVNGMGTQLYGNEPLADSQKCISTKWLVLPWIPLIPVRSYLVTIQGTDIVGKVMYRLEPLEKINWEQVKETASKSKIPYLVFIGLYIVFTLWTVSQCQ